MTTLSKTFLAVSVTALVAESIIDFGGPNRNSAWAVLLPLGAVAYGLFLISFTLEKEAANMAMLPSKNSREPVYELGRYNL